MVERAGFENRYTLTGIQGSNPCLSVIKIRSGASVSLRRASVRSRLDDPGRGVRVAEGVRLESVYTGNRIEGSNPSLSAASPANVRGSRHFRTTCRPLSVFETSPAAEVGADRASSYDPPGSRFVARTTSTRSEPEATARSCPMQRTFANQVRAGRQQP